MRPCHRIPILCLALPLALPTTQSVTPDTDPTILVERQIFVMGTHLRGHLAAATTDAGFAALEAVFAEVRRLDGVLSSWRDDSELARLNQSEPGQTVALGATLLDMLHTAWAWKQRTDGAFDPTVGSLIDAWDLRGTGRIPSCAELGVALAASGPQAIRLDRLAGTATRLAPGAWVTAGAFGKGAALRAGREVLTALGVRSALLDFGGQLLAMGSDPSGTGWTVGVAHPLQRERDVVTLRLKDVSVATSGASERFVEVAGHRYGHILDPRTGLPVPAWGSATVVAPDPFVADVLATAIFVMGPTLGMEWAAREADGVGVLLLIDGPDGLRARWNGAMEPWLAELAPELREVSPAATLGDRRPIGPRSCESSATDYHPTDHRSAITDHQASQDTSVIAELRRQIEILTLEIEELKLGREVIVEADTTLYGFGPAASKVYRVGQGVSLGGYGEMLYENFAGELENGQPSRRTDQLDFLRAILYVGYKFSDRLLFNSEIEFEHATTGGAGEASLEFAYLDWLLSDYVGARAGLLLVPMGFLNELHEPPTFLGTTRPETERQIIPSTWRENGIGIFGQAGPFSYRAYVINGLDAVGAGSSGAGGFSASGLRGGRQKGSQAIAEEVAGVARLDYQAALGLMIGSSIYVGGAGQNAESPLRPGESIGATTVVWEGHAQYRANGFDLRGLLALADVGDADEINAALQLAGDESVGERLTGWYLQAGYDVLHRTRFRQQLLPYVRYEWLDTQDEVPDGFAADPANDRKLLLLGVAWRPITNLIVKADYQIHGNEAETGVDRLNAAIGYLF